MCIRDSTATDFSDDNFTIVLEETSTQGEGDACTQFTYTITRTWTVTDDCDNASSATQIITIQDTTVPVFTNVPTDVTIECSEELPTDEPTVTDNCGEVTLTMTDDEVAGDCANARVITRTWVAEDECGNTDEVCLLYTSPSPRDRG